MTLRRVVDDVDLYYVANAKHAENRKLVRRHPGRLADRDPLGRRARRCSTPGPARPRRSRSGSARATRCASASTCCPASRRSSRWPGRTGVRRPRPPCPVASLRVLGQSLVLRASAAGDYTVTTSRRTTTRHGRPGPRADRARRRGTSPSRTGSRAPPRPRPIRPVRRVHLDALLPWSQVPGLEDVSGVGVYSTTVDLGRDWTAADGAVLELGEVNDTFRVRVNGRQVAPCDVLDTTVDLSGLLRRGRNEIEVEVATHPDQPAPHGHAGRLRPGARVRPTAWSVRSGWCRTPRRRSPDSEAG